MPETSLADAAKREFQGILLFVGAIWAVYFADFVIPGNLGEWGLRPRTLSGLVGIVTMPFLHASWGHLMANSVPLIVLLAFLAGSKARSWTIVVAIVLSGGALLWIGGRSAIHLGASGLVFGLASFLIAAGIIERRLMSVLVAIAVGLLYGGTLLFGVLPLIQGVSWDGHLAGALAGVLVAFAWVRIVAGTRSPAGRPAASWSGRRSIDETSQPDDVY